MQQAKGNIKQYKPTYKEKEIYLNSEENIIQEQLIYIGSEKTNLKINIIEEQEPGDRIKK